MFGNPVPGRIQAQAEAWDRTSFRVTSSFAEHVSSGRGGGIDLGNGRCGAPVLAMADGTVSAAFRDAGNGALIVRISHPQLGLETGYAHLQSMAVGAGVAVRRGQQIGLVGMTGADACHLHGGCKRNGVEIDWWPLLDQNIAGGTDLAWIDGITKQPVHAAIPAGVPIHEDPAQPALFTTGGASGADCFGTLAGPAVNGDTRWLAYVLGAGGIRTVAWARCSSVTPIVTGADPAAVAAAARKAAHDAAADVASHTLAQYADTKYPG